MPNHVTLDIVGFACALGDVDLRVGLPLTLTERVIDCTGICDAGFRQPYHPRGNWSETHQIL
jgi:hypothetical protein